MIIKFWLAWVIFIGLMIVLGFIGKKIASKKAKNEASGFMIGLLIGLGLALFIILGGGRAYIITSANSYSHYLVYGTTDYKMQNGTVVLIKESYHTCTVINDTHLEFGVEEVVYAIVSFSSNYYKLEAGEVEIVSTHKIDYFFDNEPPDEIEVSDRTNSVSKYWLYKL